MSSADQRLEYLENLVCRLAERLLQQEAAVKKLHLGLAEETAARITESRRFFDMMNQHVANLGAITAAFVDLAAESGPLNTDPDILASIRKHLDRHSRIGREIDRVIGAFVQAEDASEVLLDQIRAIIEKRPTGDDARESEPTPED